MKHFDYLIYIGRFQPVHLGHISTLQKALELAENVIVVCGSANKPRTPKDPWTIDERWEMIRRATAKWPNSNRISYTFCHDYLYNDQKWVEEVQYRVKSFVVKPKEARIGLIGFKKDSSSFYLNLFPQWDFVDAEKTIDINAAQIRSAYFDEMSTSMYPQDVLHESTLKYLQEFCQTEYYEDIKEENRYFVRYRKEWDIAPYPPVFVTVDAVIIQSGHILLVKRKTQPGKGNYALPGGFLRNDEVIIDGMIRELREETRLKVPSPVLKGSIKNNKVFDHPGRSLRGRTITHAFHIELVPGPLHEVKGGDDASKAKWVPLADLDDLRDQLFEDHADIISYFIG